LLIKIGKEAQFGGDHNRTKSKVVDMANLIFTCFESLRTLFQRRKLLFIFIYVIVVIFLFFKFHPNAMDQTVDHLTVLKDKIVNMTRDSRMLENILEASYKPQYNGKTIFFLESHKKEDKILAFTARQACSIEAAGKQLYDNVLNITKLFPQQKQILKWTFSCCLLMKLDFST
jgi:hypothetical protein